MHWFFIALIAPALWSITNHIDKYLLGKYFKSGGVGSLMIFSSSIGLFVLPVILVIEPNVFNISIANAFLIILSSAALITFLIPYFYALSSDEASVVVPLFQMVPVISYILAYIFLGENLQFHQIIASLLIISGAILISLEHTQKKLRLKKRIFFLMFLSSSLYAIGVLLFKIVGIQESFWVTSFWSYIGYACIGILLFLFVIPYRIQFLSVIKDNKLAVMSLNGCNEMLNIIASLCMNFASLIAPLALAQVVNGFQPFFVFFYSILLTLFFPKLGSESLLKKHLAQKILAILIIFLGTYLLNK
jgi:bacterial/archaeal transporter family protein